MTTWWSRGTFAVAGRVKGLHEPLPRPALRKHPRSAEAPLGGLRLLRSSSRERPCSSRFLTQRHESPFGSARVFPRRFGEGRAPIGSTLCDRRVLLDPSPSEPIWNKVRVNGETGVQPRSGSTLRHKASYSRVQSRGMICLFPFTYKSCVSLHTKKTFKNNECFVNFKSCIL